MASITIHVKDKIVDVNCYDEDLLWFEKHKIRIELQERLDRPLLIATLPKTQKTCSVLSFYEEQVEIGLRQLRQKVEQECFH